MSRDPNGLMERMARLHDRNLRRVDVLRAQERYWRTMDVRIARIAAHLIAERARRDWHDHIKLLDILSTADTRLQFV